MFYLAPSPKHGVGIFATTDIRAGAIIGRMAMQAVGFLADFDDRVPSVGVVGVDGMIYCPVNGFPLWAVNWDANSNIAAKPDGEVYTTRDIKRDEELFIQYHEKARKGF